MQRSNTSAKRSLLEKVGCVALSITLVLSLAFAAIIYSSITPSAADADDETMTDMINPAQQEAMNDEMDKEESEAKEVEAVEKDMEAADEGSSGSASDAQNSSIASSSAQEASSSKSAIQNEASSSSKATSAKSGTEENSDEKTGDCSATIYYFEYTNFDEEGNPTEENTEQLLGERQINGLSEGDVLNAWDYVVNIPGYFFFDGWPLNLTISKDSSQNTIKLIYMRLWQYEYTVNYYVMTGADLTADTWTDALAPDDVEFTKIGSETFTDQVFDKLVKGDAYEYKINGLYVIDTYPAQIRVGTDPDNNVINVLYTTTAANLPDDVEIPDDVATAPPEGDNGGSDSTLPGDETFDKDDLITVLPDDIMVDTNVTTPPSDDQTGSNGDQQATGSDIKSDLLGNAADRGEYPITDKMLADPVTKSQAKTALDIYKTGLHSGDLAQTGDELMPLIWTLIGIAIASAAALIIVLARRGKKHADSQI